METDTEMTSDSQGMTRDTIGSSELNAEEAEAITRSMDMSMAFWGYSENPPEKIPASRLKCPRQRSGKASSVAMKIWEKMNQQDLDKVKEIEVALMREGEIGTLDLLDTLKSLVDGTGLIFEDMLKNVDNDPLESTISLANEILHIFNQNEPPEIVEEDDYASFIHFQPVTNRRSERQRRDMSNRIKYLLNKAQKLGITGIKVPSSPYLSERSKLSLIDKQLKAKMKIRNIEQSFRPEETAGPCHEPKYSQPTRYSRKKISAHQRRERSSLSDRPKFRTAVKAESLRYEDMIKHAPDLSKRMKRVHEIRKKFMEKAKNVEGKHANNTYTVQNTRAHHYGSPYNFNAYNHSFKGKSPKKRYRLSSVSNFRVSRLESEESISNTKINITIQSNETKKNDVNILPQTSKMQKEDRSPSREDMLLEMKKMLKEAVQEVAKSTTANHPCQLIREKDPDKKEVKHKEIITEHKIKEYECCGTLQQMIKSKSKDETNLATMVEEENRDDTVVTVTQEAGIPPLWQGVVNKEDNKVSTEVKVSKSYGGQGLKVSVVSKLSGLEAEKEEQANQKRKHKNVQEAINVLKEYIAITNNDNTLNDIESEECSKESERSVMLNNLGLNEEMVQEGEESITSEAVTTTEIVIEPVSIEPDNEDKEASKEWEEEVKSNEDSTIDRTHMEEESDLQTVQAYTVTMFMPFGAREEVRPFNPFQAGSVLLNQQYSQWVAEDGGDSGDHQWSFWSGPVWSGGLEDVFVPGARNESDSLFVNTSEEQLPSINAEYSSSFQSQLSPSSISLRATGSSEGEEFRTEPSSRTIMIQAVFGFYRFFINSVVGIVAVIFKPFTLFKSLRPVNEADSDLSSSD